MTILIIVAVVTVWFMIWVTIVRPIVRAMPRFKPFFDFVEPIELFLWRKSETVLWARFQVLLGAVLEVLIQVGTINLEPIMPLIPEKYRWIPPALPIFISLFGVVTERLRRDTTKPLAVVAMRNDASPEAKAAVARLEMTNARAVEAVAMAGG